MKTQYKFDQGEKLKQLELYFNKFPLVEYNKKKFIEVLWCSSSSLFKVNAVHQFFSEQKVGFEVGNQWYLYPEEVIYLFYKGKIKVQIPQLPITEMKADLDKKDYLSEARNGIILMKFVYELKKRDNFSELYVWKCYTFLRKNSFHVRRYSMSLDIDELKEGNEEITKKTKTETENNPKATFLLKPIFQVYETNQAYFQNKVSFYLILISLEECLFELDFLASLEKSFQLNGQLKLALIDEEEVIIYDLKSLGKKFSTLHLK